MAQFSSLPPPPFLLSVITKTYINNTLVSIKITQRIFFLKTSVAQTTPDASFGPAACCGVVVCDGGHCHRRGWLSWVVDPGVGCWLSLLLLPLSMLSVEVQVGVIDVICC